MNLPLSVFKSEPSYSAVSFIPRGGRTNVHYRDSVTRSSTLFSSLKTLFDTLMTVYYYLLLGWSDFSFLWNFEKKQVGEVKFGKKTCFSLLNFFD